MDRLLFRVAETFAIQSRGVVVATDQTYRTLGPEVRLRIGDAIEFRGGGSAPVRSTVAGIEHLDPWSPSHAFAFLLPRDITKDQIAIGSEVWQLNTE